MIQLTLILTMTTAPQVETSVTVNNNSPIQDYVHQDDHTQPTYLIALVYYLSRSKLPIHALALTLCITQNLVNK